MGFCCKRGGFFILQKKNFDFSFIFCYLQSNRILLLPFLLRSPHYCWWGLMHLSSPFRKAAAWRVTWLDVCSDQRSDLIWPGLFWSEQGLESPISIPFPILDHASFLWAVCKGSSDPQDTLSSGWVACKRLQRVNIVLDQLSYALLQLGRAGIDAHKNSLSPLKWLVLTLVSMMPSWRSFEVHLTFFLWLML